MKDETSSIVRDLNSIFRLFFSSTDIPLPRVDLLEINEDDDMKYFFTAKLVKTTSGKMNSLASNLLL